MTPELSPDDVQLLSVATLAAGFAPAVRRWFVHNHYPGTVDEFDERLEVLLDSDAAFAHAPGTVQWYRSIRSAA